MIKNINELINCNIGCNEDEIQDEFDLLYKKRFEKIEAKAKKILNNPIKHFQAKSIAIKEAKP